MRKQGSSVFCTFRAVYQKHCPADQSFDLWLVVQKRRPESQPWTMRMEEAGEARKKLGSEINSTTALHRPSCELHFLKAHDLISTFFLHFAIRVVASFHSTQFLDKHSIQRCKILSQLLRNVGST